MAEIHREYDRGMTDEYRDALKNLIEQKIEHGDKAASRSLAERLADRILHVLRRGRGHQMMPELRSRGEVLWFVHLTRAG